MNDFAYDETITVFSQEQYDGRGWPPKDGAGFITWFQAHLDSIPEVYRANAKVELGSVLSYEDSHYATIEISYTRPPTAEEVAARKGSEERRRAEELRRLEAQLARLKSHG